MSYADHVLRFLEEKRLNEGRSARTVEAYGLALRRLGQFFGDGDPMQASGDQLLAFTGKWLFELGLRDPLSRKQSVCAVREFFKWSHRKGLRRDNPGEFVPHAAVGRRLPRVMTLEFAEKMMWAPDYNTFMGVRDAAIIALLIGCGLRVSGLVALNTSNLSQEVIDGRRRMVLQVREKGSKERRMPIPEHADLLLRLYLEHPALGAIDRVLSDGDEVLFVSTRAPSIPPHEYRGERRRLRRQTVNQILLRIGRQAGVPENLLHPHAFRHLFGTELAEDDVPTLMQQELLGHADPKSTELYTHLAMRKKARAVDAHNPLAKITSPVSSLLSQLKGGAR